MVRTKKKLVIIAAVMISLIIVGQFFDLPLDRIKELMLWGQGNYGWEAAIIGAIIYAVLLSIPFFPGVELAWLIIFFYGKDAVVLIYVFTLLGLTLSFSIGRRLGVTYRPFKTKMDTLTENYTDSFNKISEKIHSLFSTRQCSLFLNRVLRKSHYLVLAILINIPGNSLIGGGGGIALLTGMNRTFTFKGFLLTSAIAISPLPILLYLGFVQIDKLLM